MIDPRLRRPLRPSGMGKVGKLRSKSEIRSNTQAGHCTLHKMRADGAWDQGVMEEEGSPGNEAFFTTGVLRMFLTVWAFELYVTSYKNSSYVSPITLRTAILCQTGLGSGVVSERAQDPQCRC